MTLLPFDDRDGFIWLDNGLVPWREANIHVLTHGLHYASCVFEGERCYDGEIFKLNEHSQRLVRSAQILDMQSPLNVAEIDAASRAVIQANKVVDGYVRPLIFRGSEMMSVTGQNATPRFAVATWSWGAYFGQEGRQNGIRLTWAKYRRPAPDTAPTESKAAGLYMICTVSKHVAERAGFDDALMLDYRGQLAESTGANLFLVIDGALHTPTPDCFLNGITRQTVMGIARQRGIKVIERAIMPEELRNAAEVFLTGTAAEVTPVREIDGQIFSVGPVTRALRDEYSTLVRRHANRSAA